MVVEELHERYAQAVAELVGAWTAEVCAQVEAMRPRAGELTAEAFARSGLPPTMQSALCDDLLVKTTLAGIELARVNWLHHFADLGGRVAVLAGSKDVAQGGLDR